MDIMKAVSLRLRIIRLRLQYNLTGQIHSRLTSHQSSKMSWTWDATRAIRLSDRPDARRVPMIAMTVNAFDKDRKECFDAGLMSRHL